VLVVAPLATLAAEGETDGLTGVDWTLTSLVMDGAMGPVPEGVTPGLRLEGGQASGSTGCNQISGPYTLDGESLTFGELATTLKLCVDPSDAVEGAFLEALPKVAGWQVVDGTLQLLDADGRPLLEFSAATLSLEGTTWILSQQATDGTLGPIPEGVVATLLMEDGAAGGSGGCNSWFGDYRLDGDALSFSRIGSTMMFCEGPGSEVEQLYFANLGEVASYAIDGTQLSLLSGDGTTLLVFDAAAEPTIVGSWVATSIAMGDAVVGSQLTSQVTADFTADGQLSGSDGCNSYDATYEVDGRSIMIGPLASTKMACSSDELNDQAVAYAEAIGRATTWTVETSGALVLFSAEGTILVTYIPAGA
jgi:heat shock protein HslJ